MRINKPPSRLWKLIESERTLNFKRGEAVTDTEDLKYLWFVKSGFVKRFEILSSGNISVQGFYAAGDAFPLTYVYQVLFDRNIYHGPETYYYEAMTDTVLGRISGDKLKAEVSKDPLLYSDILAIAGNRFTSDIQLLENRGLHDAHKQVAHLIYFYATRYGITKSDGVHIPLPLTQQDYADIMGLTRETVSTCINSFKQKKYLRHGRDIIVTKLDSLENIAYQ